LSVSVQPRHIDVIQPFGDHHVYGEHGVNDLWCGSWAINPLGARGHPDGAP
jgi:hypothetical protein